MKFKDSAFIFVTGFVLFVIGGFMNSLGIAGTITYSLARSIYSSDSNSGYVVLTLFGSALALIGLIQVCMGAYRALKKSMHCRFLPPLWRYQLETRHKPTQSLGLIFHQPRLELRHSRKSVHLAVWACL